MPEQPGAVLPPFAFNDCLLVSGRVQSQKKQYTSDTATFSPEAIAVCRDLLRRLRAGELALPISPSLPGLQVSLDLPDAVYAALGSDAADRSRASGRYFTVSYHSPDYGPAPLTFALILPRTPPDAPTEESDRFALATLLGLSNMLPGTRPDDTSLEVLENLWKQRPCLLQAFGPATFDPAAKTIVPYSAAFCSVFAAVLLLSADIHEEADQRIEYFADSPLNDLLFAINHYISTGDHIGEGVALPMGERDSKRQGQLCVLIPYNPRELEDKEDFERLRTRISEIIQSDGLKLEWTDLGKPVESKFRTMGLYVAEADIPRLTAALLREPGKRGWGSGKSVIDRHFKSRAQA